MAKDDCIIRVPESRCLNCGRRLNAIGPDDDGGSRILPEPGCAVVCLRCGAVMTVDQHLRLRGFTDPEMEALIADKEQMNDIAKLVKGIYFMRHLGS